VAKLALTDLAQQPGGLKALRLLAAPAIQNNNPDHGCDHQRATESRCQCPVIYCRDLHVCRLGGVANAICEVGHKATANFADPRRGLVTSLRGFLCAPWICLLRCLPR